MALLSRTNVYDTIVVGNGILGLSIAYQLKKQDARHKVLVIGPSGRIGSATLAAGAMINVWAEIARGQFENPALADRAELGISAIDMWDPICEELAQYKKDMPSVAWGTYLLNNALGSPHEIAAADYIIECCQKRGVEHEIMQESDIPWLKPEAKGRVTRVVSLPDGRIDPFATIAAYETALNKLKVKVVDDQVVSFGKKSKGGAWKSGDATTVRTAAGEQFVCKNIVLANGSYAQTLIDQIPELKAETPRLVWGAGSAMALTLPDWVKKWGGSEPSVRDIDKVVRTVDRGGACGVHLVPRGDGEYYCGASSGVWFEPEPKARVHAIHVLLRSLVEELHRGFFFSGFSLVGPGFRPTAIDIFPLLGESHLSGIWFANGTKRDGFTCSPLISREIARGILGGKSRLPERFRPSRPLISYKNRDQAIADGAAGNFGGEVQHGLYLPPYAISNYMDAQAASIRKVYDKRDITDFGIHPEVVHLYDNDEFFAAIDHKRESVS